MAKTNAIRSAVAQEKKWQREDDARTLARAEEVKGDPARLKAARAEANRMLREQQRETKALQKVATPSPRKPAARKK